MNKLYFKTFLLACYLLSLVACADERNEGDTNGYGSSNSTTIPSIVLSMDGDTTQYIDTLMMRTETGKPQKENEHITKIVLAYPSIVFTPKVGTKDSLNDFIHNILLLNDAGALAYESVEARMTDFIEDNKESNEEDKEIYEEMGLDFTPMKWSCEVEIKVLLNTPNLLTIRYDETNFTGGAHANMATRFFNFDMRTGKQLELSDIFKDSDSYYNILMPLAQKHFRKSLQSVGKSMAYIDENFVFDKLPEHFAITAKGILFSFDPYEIGSFSDGTLQFEVPYSDLAAFINTNIIR
jgi:hypothetical protein